jgi:glycosyltransferase involved in cell wall biosynthesis
MKLLICTQAVDRTDSNLGFFHRWIEEFARHCEQVIVVCLTKGDYQFPSNVRVLSLGKEEGSSRFARVIKFYSYIWGNRRDYDAVFVHMNAEYVVLGGSLWRRWGKKVGLWYAHKSVTPALRFAMKFINAVFTVGPESFRIKSDNIRVMGHGIDTEIFKPYMRESSIETRFITIGRMSQSKHLIEMLEVFDVLHARGESFTFTIVGEPITSDEERYFSRLKQEVGKRPYHAKVIMRGGLLHDNLPQVLNLHDIFLNFATTGNMDKAALEALSCGIPVIATNDSFKNLLLPFELYVPSTHPTLIADAIEKLVSKGDKDKAALAATLRNKIVAEHSLTQLIPRITSALGSQ